MKKLCLYDLLKLKKCKDLTTEKFSSQIEKSSGQKADIGVIRLVISIVCKDIDETTTKKEVCEPVVNLPVEAVLKLLTTKK